MSSLTRNSPCKYGRPNRGTHPWWWIISPNVVCVLSFWTHLLTHSSLRFLILAATDTTSNSLTQIIELLALHPEAQEKLRGEIMQASAESGGDIAYDKLSSLPYLDAVCRESLRLWVSNNYLYLWRVELDILIDIHRLVSWCESKLSHPTEPHSLRVRIIQNPERYYHATFISNPGIRRGIYEWNSGAKGYSHNRWN